MYDAIVIGGGPAGYTAGIQVAQLGGKALIVEKSEVGGTCTNWGCIPTKTLQASADLLEQIRHAKAMGINVSSAEPDFNSMMERMDRVRKALAEGIKGLLDCNGVDLVKGEGKIVSPTEVKVGGKKFRAKNLVIATGSYSVSLPGIRPDGKKILTSEHALQLKEVPSSLAIIGGGFIGAEFATIFQKLGSDVTIIEFLPRLLPAEDPEIAGILRKVMERNGVTVMTETKVVSVRETEHGLKIEVETPAGNQVRTVEKTLVSIGRRANVEPRDLAKLGVKATRKGIKVDSHMRTTRKGVYAVGDVTGKIMLAHVAFSQGIVAAENVMGKNTEVRYNAVPNCIFTIPEVASVGAKEGDVPGARVGKFFLAASGKAKASGRAEGLVKVVIDGKTEKILGTHIIGSHASDIIAEAVLAITIGATAEDILNTMHAHPTLSEAFSEAIKDAAGRRCILKRPVKKPS